MGYSVRKKNMVFTKISSVLYDLPVPINISYMWNFGSILSVFLMTQIISGIFLAFHYSSDVELAYSSISHIMRDVNYGWLIRSVHCNGASFFFMSLYLHMGRSIYYQSYMYTSVWLMGVMIYIMSVFTAFVGYVLPWGQMSLWGATVISNLLTVIPHYGNDLILWLWGGFSIGSATLKRFFVFHFILPFLISGLVMGHIILLHKTGSNNPLGVVSDSEKADFNSYFLPKDIIGVMLVMIFFVFCVLLYPNIFVDPHNYVEANYMVTPEHIQPEWYFLFAYCILRSVPSKVGGVIAMGLSMFILFLIPLSAVSAFRGLSFYPLSKIFYWVFLSSFVALSILGAYPIEYPYSLGGQVAASVYFSFYLINPVLMLMWDLVILTKLKRTMMGLRTLLVKADTLVDKTVPYFMKPYLTPDLLKWHNKRVKELDEEEKLFRLGLIDKLSNPAVSSLAKDEGGDPLRYLGSDTLYPMGHKGAIKYMKFVMSVWDGIHSPVKEKYKPRYFSKDFLRGEENYKNRWF